MAKLIREEKQKKNEASEGESEGEGENEATKSRQMTLMASPVKHRAPRELEGVKKYSNTRFNK